MDLKALLGDKYNAEMTLDEVFAAVEDLDMVERSAFDDYVPKRELDAQKQKSDKAASDAANWKRKYRAQLDDDEQKKQEQAEMNAQLMAELETLRKEKTISEYERAFVSQGYEAKLAHDTASALADGDMDKVFANQNKFNESLRKSVSKELLNNTPEPPAGTQGGTQGKSRKEMSLNELQDLYNTNPEAFGQSE